MNFRYARFSLFAAAALFFSLAPASVLATALFSAYYDARLTITDISGGGAGLFINGLTFDDPQDSASGNATASASSGSTVAASDPFDMLAGDELSLMAQADGQANPSGSALADVFTDGEIFLDNQTGGTVVVSFSLEFDIGVDTSVMNSQSEFAFATASIEVLGEAVDVFGALLVDVFEFVESDSDFGGGPDGLLDVVAFDVTLASRASETLITSVSAFGLATATALNAPTTGGMVLLSLALVGLRHRRSS